MTVEDSGIEMQRLADALPLDRAASRWIVSSDADDMSSGSVTMSVSASGIWCSTRRDRTRRVSETLTVSMCCRAFAKRFG